MVEYVNDFSLRNAEENINRPVGLKHCYSRD